MADRSRMNEDKFLANVGLTRQQWIESKMQKIKVITVATSDTPQLQALIRSAKRHGMDLTVLGLGEPWQGFGMKIILTRDYLKTLQGYTHFIFVDAYDTLFLKPVTEVPDCLLFSTEKQPWPDTDAPYEGKQDGTWKYLNSGCYSAPINEWLKLVEETPPQYSDDDQRYFTSIHLGGKIVPIILDKECTLFQSYAFAAPGDFTITDTLTNNITKTQPAIIHFNGKCLDQKIYNMAEFSTLNECKERWKDTQESHRLFHETFIQKVNDNEKLSAHRTFVENHILGFGERSFYWMWNLLVKEMPKDFTFLEVGVFKGQILSLIRMLADMHGKKVKRYGVTPLTNEGLEWGMEDYKAAIDLLHDEFNIAKDYNILHGLSEAPEIIKQAAAIKLDLFFLDGGHEERHVENDLKYYAPLVKPGGYMVIDDSCNSFSMQHGYFQGIESVTRVVDRQLPPATPSSEWQFLFNVMHNRVYKRL